MPHDKEMVGFKSHRAFSYFPTTEERALSGSSRKSISTCVVAQYHRYGLKSSIAPYAAKALIHWLTSSPECCAPKLFRGNGIGSRDLIPAQQSWTILVEKRPESFQFKFRYQLPRVMFLSWKLFKQILLSKNLLNTSYNNNHNFRLRKILITATSSVLVRGLRNHWLW